MGHAARTAVAALLAGALLAACTREGPAPISAFEGRVADWTAEIVGDEPERAALGGAQVDGAGAALAGRITDRSALALEARRSAAMRRLAEVRSLTAKDLEPDAALLLTTIRARFESAAAGAAHGYGDFSTLGGPRPYTLDAGEAAFATLPAHLAHLPVRDAHGAEVYLTAIDAAGAAMRAEAERARADAEAGASTPDFLIDASLARLEAMLGAGPGRRAFVDDLLAKLDALAGADAAQAERLKPLRARAEAAWREKIVPALQATAATLRAMRAGAPADAGVWRLPEGEQYYRDALYYVAGAQLSPDQIHRIALDRARAVEPQLDIALRRIGMTEGPIGARLAQMLADPRYRYADDEEGRAALLNDATTRAARVTELAPRWFGTLPRAPLQVEATPQNEEAGAPAYAYAPPIGDGAGAFRINLSRTGEISRIGLPSDLFAMGAPGAHYPLALEAQRTNAPLLSRLIWFAAARDGWRAYGAELADELGLYEGDAAGRIGYLRGQLRIAVLAVADTGVHARRWPRERAIEYIVSETGEAPGEAAAAVNAIAARPGQACAALLGRREIIALREEARTRLGADFDLKGFHDAVLSASGAPPAGLAARVRAWANRQPGA